MILAIDPSLRGTGYAILAGKADKVRCLEYGVIVNSPQLTQPACLVAIHEKLTSLITTYHPKAIAIESIIYVQSYDTAIILGSARGAALLAAAQKGIPIQEYPPKQVKQAIVGRGSATKDQVSFMVKALLGLTETPPSDAADAMAIGLTHLRSCTQTSTSALPIIPRKKKMNVAEAWKKKVEELSQDQYR